jgi:hypothetical protein
VGVYRDQVLPRGIDLVLRGREFAGPRARVAAGLKGEVLEIGFGSGLNIPFYPAGLKRVRAVDSTPAGRRRFVEHGPAPDERIARLQRRLTPLRRRAFGGCRLDRRIDQLVAAAGLELTRLDTYYMQGPRALGYTFEGVAVRS